MLGKAWQAVLDQCVGKMWKRPGSGPEGTVQLLAEAALTLKDLAPVAFCQRGPPSKGSTATAVPAGQQHSTHKLVGDIQTAASTEHEHGRLGVKVRRGCK